MGLGKISLFAVPSGATSVRESAVRLPGSSLNSPPQGIESSGGRTPGGGCSDGSSAGCAEAPTKGKSIIVRDTTSAAASNLVRPFEKYVLDIWAPPYTTVEEGYAFSPERPPLALLNFRAFRLLARASADGNASFGWFFSTWLITTRDG